MNQPLAATLVGLLVCSAAATSILGVVAWRERSRPGALPFVGLMATVTVWSLSYLIELTVSPGGRVLWERTQWFGIAFVPVFFLAFAMDYLGHEALTPRFVAGLSVLPAVTVGLVWTNPEHLLIWQTQSLNTVAGLQITEQSFGTWYWVNLAYAYVCIGVGSYLLLRLAVLSDRLYLDQSLSLFVGVVVPLVANAVSVVGRTPVAGIDLTPFALTVTGIAFGNALFRYRLFELAPATWQIGQETVVGNLDDAIVIVDTEGTVVYANDEAESLFDLDVTEVVGEPVTDVVDAADVDFDAPDAMGETEIDDRTYEVRASEIVDRHGRELGDALVFNDITERVRREQALERQRDHLQTLERLNGVIRGVNRELVAADSREEVTDAVRDALSRSALYDAVWMVDETAASARAIEADGAGIPDGGPVETGFASARDAVDQLGDGDLDDDEVAVGSEADGESLVDEPGRCISVPVVYGKTVYGALVLYTTRTDAFAERELAVLDELGESVGHAINAADKAQSLVADAVTELEFDISGADAALPRAAATAGCEIDVAGTATGDGGTIVAYLRVEGADAEAVGTALADSDDVTDVRIVSEADPTVLECTLTGGSVLFPLREYGATLEALTADNGDGTVVVTVSPEADVRTVVERVERDYPGASLAAKRRRDDPVDTTPDGPAFTEDLTERQMETLEAAYAAGYFEWPRDSTAEEVADSMGIAAPTLHSHLRKAQNRVLRSVLEEDVEG